MVGKSKLTQTMVAAIRRFKAQRHRSATEFAQRLGISRTHLYREMKKLPKMKKKIVGKGSLQGAVENSLSKLCAKRRAAKLFGHVSAKAVHSALPKKFRLACSVLMVARIIRKSGMRRRHPQTSVTEETLKMLADCEMVLTQEDCHRESAIQRLQGW